MTDKPASSAEEEAAKKVPIERPAGEPNRKAGKLKKNKKGIVKERKTFDMCEAMQASPTRVSAIKVCWVSCLMFVRLSPFHPPTEAPRPAPGEGWS